MIDLDFIRNSKFEIRNSKQPRIPNLKLRISLVCLGASLAVLCGCSRSSKAAGGGAPSTPTIGGETIEFPAGSPHLSYLAIEPVRERSSIATGLNGRLAWDDDVTARVFSAVSGRVVEIVANPGQHVQPGDALAKIRSPDFGQAQADARKATADLKTAERALERTRELLKHGAAAEKDLETAEAEHTRAVSEKERAVATLSIYGGNADATGVDGFFSLKAPIGGVVVERALNPGQEVRSDQVGDKPLVVISDPTRLWLFLDVTEADVASMRPGQEVLVRARALPDKIFRGRIEIIGEGLDPATRTIKARCLVDNADKALRAEMYVSADVTSSTTGVDIPTKAVFLKDNQHYVFIEKAPGRFERREISLGAESEGRSVVLNGVAAGQRVVTQGCLLLEAMLEGENS
jgi:cobalt-zinc-cadmium efflux system membrane fusion protein